MSPLPNAPYTLLSTDMLIKLRTLGLSASGTLVLINAVMVGKPLFNRRSVAAGVSKPNLTCSFTNPIGSSTTTFLSVTAFLVVSAHAS